MRDILTQWSRRASSAGGPGLKCTTVLIVVMVLSSQVMLVWNVQNKFKRSADGNSQPNNAHKQDRDPSSDADADAEVDVNSLSLDQMVDLLPPAELNEFRFRSEVERPARDMVEKFQKHPEMVLSKMKKFLEKEEKKSQSLMEEVAKVRTVLGMEQKEKASGFQSRKLQALSYSSAVQKCPEHPPNLLGPLIVKTEKDPDSPEPSVGTEAWRDWYGPVREGGKYRPQECEARQKVAIIVPFRDRAEHLELFLHHMHPVLQRQQLDYQIFIIEQSNMKQPFNRAALMNIGYREATKASSDFDCFVFHDVDLVPEDDRNLYTCPEETPKHLAVAVNKWKYRLIYEKYFGGVTALTKRQFERINGFANSFYGWGGEDDDLYHRVVEKHGYKIFRYPGNIARYSMLKHEKVDKGDALDDLMEKSKNDELSEDGLSTLRYRVLEEKAFPLYTWYLAKLPDPPKRKKKAEWWSFAKNSLLEGMSQKALNMAQNIADSMSDKAKQNDEEREDLEDHIY